MSSTKPSAEAAAKIARLLADGWGSARVVPEGTYAGTRAPNDVDSCTRWFYTAEIREATEDEPMRLRVRRGVA